MTLNDANAVEVKVRYPFTDDSLRRDVTALCNDVVVVFSQGIGKPPFLGVKPFVIQKAPDDIPRACLNGLPKEYQINLTSIETRFYQQITFQLGHELSHHYANPYRSNWFVESVCHAQSLLTLSAMGRKRKTNPHWAPTAFQFEDYRTNQIMAWKKMCSDQVKGWIKTTLPGLVRDKKVDRPEQGVCAIAIEEAFLRHPRAWGALCLLGEASDTNKTDFVKWESLVTEEERPLVHELAEQFGNLP